MSLATEQALIYQALASPLGIVLVVSEPRLAYSRMIYARNALIKAEPSSKDTLMALTFRQVPENELWIIKGQTEGKSGYARGASLTDDYSSSANSGDIL